MPSLPATSVRSQAPTFIATGLCAKAGPALKVASATVSVPIEKAPLALLFFLAAMGTAASEPFSVSCESDAPVTSYFATFDMERKRVVFETPPTNPAGDQGINLLSGEIDPAGQGADGRVAFSLRTSSGRISLVLDTATKRMIWPGLEPRTFRPALWHRCTFGPARSILSFRNRDPVIRPTTVRCNEAGYMYFTMDVESKRAAFERGAEGRTFEGRVSGTRSNVTDLDMNWGAPGRVSWDRGSKILTIADSQGGPDKTLVCEEVAPRTMIDRYDARF